LIAAAVVGIGVRQISGFAVVALLLLPAAECAVALINQIATTLVSPKSLPKLDFAKGIPEECTTIVAVPTLLTSIEQMKRAVRDLEIRFPLQKSCVRRLPGSSRRAIAFPPFFRCSWSATGSQIPAPLGRSTVR